MVGFRRSHEFALSNTPLTIPQAQAGTKGQERRQDREQRCVCWPILFSAYGADSSTSPDLLEPLLLRSLLNVKSVSIHSSCAGCHFVVIDIQGNAWLFGRNGFSALGVAGVDFVSENAPHCIKPTELGAAKGTKFVHAACGRNHTLLVGSDGSVWAAGQNNLGQVSSMLVSGDSRFLMVLGVVWSSNLPRDIFFPASERFAWRK